MVSKRISELPAAGALDGSEQIPLVQDNETRRIPSDTYQKFRVVDLTQKHGLTDGGELADAFASAMGEPAGGLIIVVPVSADATIQTVASGYAAACEITRDDVIVVLDPGVTINTKHNGENHYGTFLARNKRNVQIIGSGTIEGDPNHTGGQNQGSNIIFFGVEDGLIDGPTLNNSEGDNYKLVRDTDQTSDPAVPRSQGCVNTYVTKRTQCTNARRQGGSVTGLIGGGIGGHYDDSASNGLTTEANSGSVLEDIEYDEVWADRNAGAGARIIGGSTTQYRANIGRFHVNDNGATGLEVFVTDGILGGPVYAEGNGTSSGTGTDFPNVKTADSTRLTIVEGAIKSRVGSNTNKPAHGLTAAADALVGPQDIDTGYRQASLFITGIGGVDAPLDAGGNRSVGLPIRTQLAAMVKRTNAQSIADSTVETISWEATEFDDLLVWDSGSPTRLTVPDGVRRVRIWTVSAWGVNSTGTRQVRLHKNGSLIGRFDHRAAEGTSAASGEFVLTVTPGDYFELKVYQTSGDELDFRNFNTDRTQFGMEMLA